LNFEYPFGGKWVLFSGVLSGISIALGLIILSRDWVAIVMYLVFVLLCILVVLPLKFFFYLKKEEEIEEEPTENLESGKNKYRLKIIIFSCLIIMVLFSPFILAVFMDPVWWVILISGVVPGVNVPEIILYVFSKVKNR